MWELDYKESWVLKNWCIWSMVLGRFLRVPWIARRSNQSILEKNQFWIFIGRTDDEAETPILWPPDANNWLIWKDPDAGRDWGQEEKGMTEDEMAGWNHRLGGRESGWTPGVGDGQGGLACCDSWGCKESDTTERLIWSNLMTLSTLPFINNIVWVNDTFSWSPFDAPHLMYHSSSEKKVWFVSSTS